MSEWHLVQLNIAQLKAPIDSELLTDFVANLDRINALAEQAPGFVWRLVDADSGNVANYGFDSQYIVNLSIWESIELLHDYVYRSAHVSIMRRKNEWFERMPRAHMVLWWQRSGELPTSTQAKEKLEHLQTHGPTRHAFTFRQAFEKPDS